MLGCASRLTRIVRRQPKRLMSKLPASRERTHYSACSPPPPPHLSWVHDFVDLQSLQLLARPLRTLAFGNVRVDRRLNSRPGSAARHRCSALTLCPEPPQQPPVGFQCCCPSFPGR